MRSPREISSPPPLLDDLFRFGPYTSSPGLDLVRVEFDENKSDDDDLSSPSLLRLNDDLPSFGPHVSNGPNQRQGIGSSYIIREDLYLVPIPNSERNWSTYTLRDVLTSPGAMGNDIGIRLSWFALALSVLALGAPHVYMT